jgi:transposase-like protein
LQFSKSDLRLAVQQSCTGGERVSRLAQTEMLWRQVWLQWRRQLGLAYQSLRSVAKHWFSGELRDFLVFAGAEHQLETPDVAQLPALLTAAEQALLQQRRLELVQHLFRRPLELWLVLDLALFLEEHGYQIQLSELCDASLTPRNLLLQASKAP